MPLVLCLGLAWISAGCRTAPPLPPADCSQPGWRLQQGQAVWTPSRQQPELTGELLLATHPRGDYLVEFAKTPFSFASAQVAGERWQVEFGAANRGWHGQGQPPVRFVWFQLPRALAGGVPDSHWEFHRREDGGWRLWNHRTGESLEGRFFP